MSRKYSFIFSILIILGVVSFAKSQCQISTTGKKPLLWKYLGSQSVVIPATTAAYQLKDNEIINAQCGGIFIISSNRGLYNSEKFQGNIALKCSGSNVYIRRTVTDQWKHITSYDTKLGCEQGQSTIYESIKHLPHCEKYLSYGIGARVSKDEQIITLGMCFDLANLQPKYIVYTPSNFNALVDVQKITPVDPESFSLDLELIGFEEFYKFTNESDYNKNLADFGGTNLFLRPFTFEYASLIQDESINRDTQQYKEMLSVVWWRNLRLGNWKIFIDALRVQSNERKYKIFLGVHGVSRFPAEGCYNERQFTLKIGQQTISAPQYIWALVKPLDDDNEEEPFVFVGKNSPFKDNDIKSNSFCDDICEDIDWLYDGIFNRTHKSSDFGLVNCCHPEYISTIFENFPFDKSQEKTKRNATESVS